MDTLARIIRIFSGKRGKQLPTSMSKMLKSEKVLEIDSEFFGLLRHKLLWYSNLLEDRDNIVHHVGNLKFTITRAQKLGFDLLSDKDFGRSWGTDTIKSIPDFMGEHRRQFV